LVLGN
jgi:hypothetical protein